MAEEAHSTSDQTGEANPFLSEFDRETVAGRVVRGMGLRWLLPDTRRRLGYRTAGTALGIAVALCALSIASGAGRIIIQLTTQDPDSIRYGYLFEMNHGLFTVVLFPILVIAAFTLIDEAHRGMVALSRAGSVTPSEGEVLDVLRRANRKCFGIPTLLVLLAIPIAVISTVETKNYHDLAFGWVQSEAIQDYRPGQSLEDISATRTLKGITGIEDLAATKIKSIQGGTTEDLEGWFWVFLFSALVFQMAMHIFILWVLLKIILVLRIYHGAITDRGFRGVHIRTECDHADQAFGLRHLHHLYNSCLVLVTLGAIGFCFSVVSNRSKGSFSGDNPRAAASAALGQGGVFLLATAITAVVGAFAFFHCKLLSGRKSNELDAVIGDIQATQGKRDAGDGDVEVVDLELERLRDKRDRIEAQRIWPLNDSGFKALAKITTACIIGIPLLAGLPQIAECFAGIWNQLIMLIYNLVPGKL